MNKEQNKFDYGTLLNPPAGYQLTKAIGTTYSLDLKAMLSIPISFHFRSSIDSELLKDPYTLFISLKDTAKKIDVFCQLGGIHDNVKSEKLFRFLEASIHQINLPNEKSFHPKVWIVRYDHSSRPAIYKVIVLSRNLTFDCSWDMIVGLEGEVHSAVYDIDKKTNQPLVNFVNFLYRTTSNPPPEDFMNDLFRVTFRPIGNSEYSKITFIPLGIDNDKNIIPFIFNDPKSDPWQKILITSPFVANSILKKVKQNSMTLHLISRQQTLEGLNQKLLRDIQCYYINEKIVNGSSYREEEEIEDSANIETEKVKLYDLHAKTYLLSSNSNYELFVGSGNATESAFAGNVEFFVKITGRTLSPIETFKETYFNETNDFLVSYDPDLNLKPIPEDEYELLVQSTMKQFLTQLDKIHAEAVLEEQNLFQIALNIDSQITLPPGCGIFIRPFHLPSDHNKGLNSSTRQIIFNSIGIVDLSLFFIIKAIHFQSNTEQRCIIKLPITNLPDKREEWVVRSLLGNKKDFFRLLRLLLAEDIFDMLYNKDYEENSNNRNKWRYSSGFETPLFELMLKAASRDKKKLEEISTVIAYLKDDDPTNKWTLDQEIVDFLEIWNHFKHYLPR